MPLDVINKAAMKEKTIRHGHPSTFISGGQGDH